MSNRQHLFDELLVLRCRQGDASAFEELVARWQSRLWRHAWRLTSSEDAAWDILQETWMGIARGIGRLENEAAFPAWAYRIASNKCHEWTRRETRRRKAIRTYAETAEKEESKADAARDQQSGLGEALAQLSGRDRAILSLRYEESFSAGEIAEILDIPTGTVKSRLHYARQRLRTKMEEDNDE